MIDSTRFKTFFICAMFAAAGCATTGDGTPDGSSGGTPTDDAMQSGPDGQLSPDAATHSSPDARSDATGTMSQPDSASPSRDASAPPTPDASTGPVDSGTTPPPPPEGSNVVTATVDQGPSSDGVPDTLYVSVTLCRPGTTTCQTIDHIQVDTGSTGFRVIASALDSSLGLTDQTSGSGTLVECFTYADGYVWGPIANADIQIGGEVAPNAAIQVIGDPNYGTVPRSCSETGSSEDTVDTFGANGIIGISPTVTDCGTDCETTQYSDYYSCRGTTCSIVGVPAAQQVLNPVTLFATDNNGTLIQLPALSGDGTATATGSLIFGIGTQSNNALGSAAVLTVDPDDASFSTTFGGQSMAESFIDSGSNAFYFNDNSLTQCSGQSSGFYCPSSIVSLTAQNVGMNGTTSSVSFNVGNANTILGGSVYASSDLGGTGFQGSGFDWGLPFFYGRSIFTAVVGASTPGGTGPYVAY